MFTTVKNDSTYSVYRPHQYVGVYRPADTEAGRAEIRDEGKQSAADSGFVVVREFGSTRQVLLLYLLSLSVSPAVSIQMMATSRTHHVTEMAHTDSSTELTAHGEKLYFWMLR